MKSIHLEIDENEYIIMRRALETLYYVIKDNEEWSDISELDTLIELDNLEHKLIKASLQMQ